MSEQCNRPTAFTRICRRPVRDAKTIAMNTIQKTAITATIALLAGAVIYEARQGAQWRGQNRALQQQQAALAEQIQQLRRDRDEAASRWAHCSPKTSG